MPWMTTGLDYVVPLSSILQMPEWPFLHLNRGGPWHCNTGYFIFLDPILLQKELAPLTIRGNTTHFLSIVPIFGDELDYKMGKGTQKFVRKFIQRNNDEKLDDYRKSVLNSRMRFF